jgi:hypothetical protein
LLVLFATPMVIALVSLHHTTWYPMLDMAQTDMRIRAVGTAHPPLIGLPGRIGPPGQQGSHPGPLSFWLLWPFSRLAGGGSWSLFASSFALHLVAMATALWLAFRRGGAAVMLAVGLVLVVVAHTYGVATLSQPWNPYLPLMAWLVVLLAAWSVLDDDLPVLPVLIFAASFCMQTHLPYLGLAGGLVAVVVVIAAVVTVLRRDDATRRRDLLRWGLVAVGVGVLVWIPPVLDELTNSPGNLTLIWRDLTNPPEAAGGLHQGVRLLLVHLNPWTVVGTRALHSATDAALVPGAVFAVVWLASLVAAWRIRLRTVVNLDIVLGAATALAFFSMSKIHGPLYYYLTLWAWGTCALMVLAVCWTAVELVARRRRDDRSPVDVAAGGAPVVTSQLGLAGRVGLVAGTVLFAVMMCIEAASVKIPTPRLNATLGGLVAPTISALRGPISGERSSGRILVTWSDPLALGSQAWGLMDQLDRAGFRIGLLPAYRGAVRSDQLVSPSSARVVVHVAVGPPDIALWRAKPGVRQVAFVDPRTPAQRAEYERLRSEVILDLKAAHLATLVPAVDYSLVFVLLNENVPMADRNKLARMLDLGLPVAVFVGPGDAAA